MEFNKREPVVSDYKGEDPSYQRPSSSEGDVETVGNLHRSLNNRQVQVSPSSCTAELSFDNSEFPVKFSRLSVPKQY